MAGFGGAFGPISGPNGHVCARGSEPYAPSVLPLALGIDYCGGLVFGCPHGSICCHAKQRTAQV